MIILAIYAGIAFIAFMIYSEKFYHIESEFGIMLFMALIWPISLPLAWLITFLARYE
jgi:hypothetical protein